MANTSRNEMLLHFFGSDKRRLLLKGEAHIQGTRIETSNIRLTKFKKPSLYFIPNLTTSKIDSNCFPILLQYLENYKPLSSKGSALFFPSGEFSLYQHKLGLTFYLINPVDWGGGEEIKIINRSVVDNQILEDKILELQKASSFVFGNLVERKDYKNHIILRMYYNE